MEMENAQKKEFVGAKMIGTELNVMKDPVLMDALKEGCAKKGIAIASQDGQVNPAKLKLVSQTVVEMEFALMVNANARKDGRILIVIKEKF